MTQGQLGKRINVTKVSVSGYESGNRTPDMETIQKIADVFGVSVDYLLGRVNRRDVVLNSLERGLIDNIDLDDDKIMEYISFLSNGKIVSKEEFKAALTLIRASREQMND